MNNQIDLFCGINSVGMPFPRENKKHIGYFDIVKKSLMEQGYNVNGINISSLNKNHTWDLERTLNLNYSLSQIKNIQMYSIDTLRNANILFKLVVPKKFKERYAPTLNDNKITFKDVYINSQNPIFIYSAGPNDFFTYIHAGPVELMDQKVRNNLPNNLEELVIQVIDNIENNWLLLQKLNPKVIIPCLSFYYSPLFDKIQKFIFLQERKTDKEKKYNNRFGEIINLYNSLLEERTQKYDFVEYIDLTFIKNYCAPMDFHPNTRGNEIIAHKIMECLNNKKIDFSKFHR